MRTTALSVVVLAAGATVAAASGRLADDDLAVVRRAVSNSPQATGGVPSEQSVTAPTPARKAEPQWLRVRVTEKGRRKGKVSINLPLALVRALGDDFPCPVHLGSRSLKLGDVLRALDTGQQLVEVDDDEATVRIWVE